MPTGLIRKVDVVWGGLPGAPFYTQFFFGHEAGSATATAGAVKTFLTAFASNLAQGLQSQIQSEQTIIDTATGKPVNVEVATAQTPTTYVGTGDPLPWASQVILRLSTAQFNNGRRLRGRIFIPGILESMCTAGTLAAASQTTFNTPAAALISATSSTGKWAVWSRAHLQWASVDSATCWDQFGMLRKRRP